MFRRGLAADNRQSLLLLLFFGWLTWNVGFAALHGVSEMDNSVCITSSSSGLWNSIKFDAFAYFNWSACVQCKKHEMVGSNQQHSAVCPAIVYGPFNSVWNFIIHSEVKLMKWSAMQWALFQKNFIKGWERAEFYKGLRAKRATKVETKCFEEASSPYCDRSSLPPHRPAIRRSRSSPLP